MNRENIKHKGAKNSKVFYLCALVSLCLTSFLLAEAAQNADESQVPLPPGKDIRKILTPKDLTDAEVKSLEPKNGEIRHYYEIIETPVKKGNASFIKIEMFFISLFEVDYPGVNAFASKVLDPASGATSVDSVISALPNLMAYLSSISVGDLKRSVVPAGPYQRVTLDFVLNEQALAKRYPGLAGRFDNNLADLTLDLRNSNTDLLLSFRYTNDAAKIKFVMDPRGFLVPTGKDGRPSQNSAGKLGLDEAHRGVRLYLDIGFKSQATLLKIFKLLVVNMERIRARVDLKLAENRLAIAYAVTDVVPGMIHIAGTDSTIIRDNLLDLKDTLKGTADFMPITTRSGKNLTFGRVYATGEEMDNWLIHIALTTWEAIGLEALAELSVPVSEAMEAIKKDMMLHNRP